MTLRRTLLSLMALFATPVLLSVSGEASAASSSVLAHVNRVLLSNDNRWGGCMANLSVDPNTRLASCGREWVTFSCSGHFTDPVRAYRSVDVAELALATGKRVIVYFRDTEKHNGYCFADRIDIVR